MGDEVSLRRGPGLPERLRRYLEVLQAVAQVADRELQEKESIHNLDRIEHFRSMSSRTSYKAPYLHHRAASRRVWVVIYIAVSVLHTAGLLFFFCELRGGRRQREDLSHWPPLHLRDNGADVAIDFGGTCAKYQA